jgi:ArsR family transcriptional regulator, arsenate/arsenite/antimonite-responsive transcriptional repressor
MDNTITQRVAAVLKAIGHPIRLQIIGALEHQELAVNPLAELLSVQQAVISRHLAIMKEKGVLACRRDKLYVYYRIANPAVIQMLHCIYANCSAENKG